MASWQTTMLSVAGTEKLKKKEGKKMAAKTHAGKIEIVAGPGPRRRMSMDVHCIGHGFLTRGWPSDDVGEAKQFVDNATSEVQRRSCRHYDPIVNLADYKRLAVCRWHQSARDADGRYYGRKNVCRCPAVLSECIESLEQMLAELKIDATLDGRLTI